MGKRKLNSVSCSFSKQVQAGAGTQGMVPKEGEMDAGGSKSNINNTLAAPTNHKRISTAESEAEIFKSLKVCQSFPKYLIYILCFRSEVLKVWSGGPCKRPPGSNYFPNTTKNLYAFVTLVLSQMYSEVFQRLHGVWLHDM